MTETMKRVAVGFAALAAAGVIGGVTALALVGQQQPTQDVRTVSDEASATPTAQASPTVTGGPVASPAAAASPGAGNAKPRNPEAAESPRQQSRSGDGPAPRSTAARRAAEPGHPEPAPAPTTGPPPPAPPVECLPQEFGTNPRCPLPAGK
ncbi:hypothetical protein CSH63_33170 [Micromonospora tulbaghiae]|uniref:Uncharacterized protein n=1 Tax=Micromonospora tulbaghiae TaxID=479978 RepID=A0A386WUQ0_9ACTN|nr:hypothetical protein [Micromonospora tulbaghiae]AYF32207.1 hypothetical protein CSH63_33170 [Micromonospora tulbaghiae]